MHEQRFVLLQASHSVSLLAAVVAEARDKSCRSQCHSDAKLCVCAVLACYKTSFLFCSMILSSKFSG